MTAELYELKHFKTTQLTSLNIYDYQALLTDTLNKTQHTSLNIYDHQTLLTKTFLNNTTYFFEHLLLSNSFK